MCEHDPTPELQLPPLTDEAAVEILDFLCDLLTAFENRYSAQVRRYYQDRSCHNLIEPDRNRAADDPPF
ncbi:MAG: hypothetical protein FJ035_08545 [Chloroflexi bacterium]|nr:hypothetical protein [Chloroflexota bacterium]